MAKEQELKDLETRIFSFPERASFLTVHSQATLDRANQFVKNIKAFKRHLDIFFDTNIKRLHQAHKEAKAQKDKFEEPLKEAESIVKKEIGKYLIEQDRIRQEAERKLREEKEKVFQKARELEREGGKQEAEQMRKDETALASPLPPVVKADGTHLRKHWTWEVVDIDKVPRERFILDVLEINKIVREQKGNTRIPGIRVFQESTVATRIK